MQGKVVIVTGGAKGIGRHAAHTLAKAGANVVIADADAERMHKTLGEIQQINREAIATEDAPEEARKRLPGPESLGNGFVLATQAGMEMTGKTVEHRDGKLIAVD